MSLAPNRIRRSLKHVLVATLGLTLLATSAGAQAGGGYGVSQKDPGLATVISLFIPGGGHLYAGESRKGATILGVAYGSLIAGAATTSCSFGSGCRTWPIYVGVLGYLGAWAYGVADASNAARRANTGGFGVYDLRPEVSSLPDGRLGLGLSARLGR